MFVPLVPPTPPPDDDLGHDEPILKCFYFEQPATSSRRNTATWHPNEHVLMIDELKNNNHYSCTIVESITTTVTSSPLAIPNILLPIKLEPLTRLKRFKSKWKKQFFESINPKSDFKNSDALDSYLYDKSLEIQPKGNDPPVNDVKPKHSPSALRSPGIKAPKPGNHYSKNHPLSMKALHHSMQQHHASTVPNTPTLLHEPLRSFSHHDDTQDRYDRKVTPQKHTVLQAPPLLPKTRNPPNLANLASLPPTTVAPMPPAPKTSGFMSNSSSPTSLTTTPSSSAGPAPKLYPRKHQPMSPLAKSPLTPSNDNSTLAFQFPTVYQHNTAPPLPPRLSNSSHSEGSSSSPSSSSKENQEQLQVIFDREESHSPTVRLSVPLPPALPPPRGSAIRRVPPPIPPKTNRRSSDSPISSPTNDPTSPAVFINTPSSAPPPLPPKTYKTRRQD